MQKEPIRKLHFIFLLLMFACTTGLAQDSLKMVPGISIAPMIAVTPQIYPISGYIDWNINATLNYGKNTFATGPIIGKRRMFFPTRPEHINPGISGILFSYQRQLDIGKKIIFNAEYNLIHRFIYFQGRDDHYLAGGEEYSYTNVSWEQILTYVLHVPFGKRLYFSHHAGIGYGFGRVNLDYKELSIPYDEKLYGRGLSFLLKTGIGYQYQRN